MSESKKPRRLNCQGMSRSCESLMRSLIADPGYVIRASDIVSAEPTIICQFSGDPYYYAASFGMIGKKPYYDEQGILMIDDNYLMGASFSPIGRDKVREAFHSTWNGVSFPDLWLQDPEFLKGELKKPVRALHKTMILGIGYGMGAKKMVKSAYEQGFTVSTKDAKEFIKRYWSTFHKVKQLDEYLQAQFRIRGFIVNQFGYRLKPKDDYKVLNAFIQSTVQGEMSALLMKFYELCPFAVYQALIHDEVIDQIPGDRVEEAKALWYQAEDWLNASLKWNVKVRTGWKTGQTWYDIK